MSLFYQQIQLDIRQLCGDKNNTMQQSFLLRADESRHKQLYHVFGMPVYLKTGGADTDGQFSMFTAEHTKNQGPPLHRHNIDETFYITAGEFLFQIGDERYTAVAGDTLFIPRDMPHAYLTLSDQGTLLFVVGPAASVEALFDAYNSFDSTTSMDEIMRVSAELGCPILGPPLSNG